MREALLKKKAEERKAVQRSLKTQIKLREKELERCASLALSPLPLTFSYKSEKSLCGTGRGSRR